MVSRDIKGAEKFRDAMLGMSGHTVGQVEREPASNSSGMIYKINRRTPPVDGLRIRQGFGRAKFEGSLGFQFTMAKAAQVDGFLSLEDIAKQRFRNHRGRDEKGMFLRTNTDRELDRLITYLEEICPKISQELFPEWHASRS